MTPSTTPLRPPDPIEALKFRMEQQGLKPKDLQPVIGGLNRVYEVLNRKKTAYPVNGAAIAFRSGYFGGVPDSGDGLNDRTPAAVRPAFAAVASALTA